MAELVRQIKVLKIYDVDFHPGLRGFNPEAWNWTVRAKILFNIKDWVYIKPNVCAKTTRKYLLQVYGSVPSDTFGITQWYIDACGEKTLTFDKNAVCVINTGVAGLDPRVSRWVTLEGYPIIKGGGFDTSGFKVNRILIRAYWDASQKRVTKYEAYVNGKLVPIGEEIEKPKPEFKVTEFKVEPTEVNIGEKSRITVYLTSSPNTQYTATLYINNNPIDSETITTGYDGKGVAIFSFVPTTYGTYTVKVCFIDKQQNRYCTTEKTITVKKPVLAPTKAMTQSVELNVAKTNVSVNEPTELRIYIKSTKGSADITIYADSSILYNNTHNLQEGENTIRLPITITKEGSYTLRATVKGENTVTSNAITINVSKPTVPKPTVPEIPEEAKFGAIILLGLGALALAKKKKR